MLIEKEEDRLEKADDIFKKFNSPHEAFNWAKENGKEPKLWFDLWLVGKNIAKEQELLKRKKEKLKKQSEITIEERLDILNMKRAGKTNQEIAEIIGTTRIIISKIVRQYKNNKSLRRLYKKAKIKEVEDEIQKLYSEGRKVKDLVYLFGIKESQVKHIVLGVLRKTTPQKTKIEEAMELLFQGKSFMEIVDMGYNKNTVSRAKKRLLEEMDSNG